MAGYLRFIKFSGYLSNQTKRKEYVPLVFLLVRPQIISRWVALLTATFSGFGYSWNIHPLADCVKSALTLLLGIINLCSSFWEKNTVLTWARGFLFMFLAPFPFPARVCGESPAVNSAGSLIYYEIEPCHLLENNQKFTIRKERNAFVFNRKVCKQVRLISRESEQQQGSF